MTTDFIVLSNLTTRSNHNSTKIFLQSCFAFASVNSTGLYNLNLREQVLNVFSDRAKQPDKEVSYQGLN